MEILLLAVLVLTEAGFMALELKKDQRNRDWKTRRFLVNGIEVLVFLIVFFLTEANQRFRFIILGFLLIIGLVITGICYLIHNNDAALKSRLSIIAGMFGRVLLLLAALLPAFIFTDYSGRPVTGEYKPAECTAILIDKSRIEEFEEDGSYREVPAHFYYPEDAGEEPAKSMPLVVFSHGAFGYYQSNTSTYMELASHGYIVVSLDHPYHSFFTTDTEGKTILADRTFLQDALRIGSSDLPDEEIFPTTSQWMKLRIDDLNFAIDTIKTSSTDRDTIIQNREIWCRNSEEYEKLLDALGLIDVRCIGIMGHSMGGAAAVTVGRRDDVSAVVDLDGTMLGEELALTDGNLIYNEAPYCTPLLEIQNEEHHMQSTEARQHNVIYVNNLIMDHAETGFRTFFAESGHMNFTDLPLFAPAFAEMLGTGKIDATYCIDQMNRIILDFFDCYLKGTGIFSANEKY